MDWMKYKKEIKVNKSIFVALAMSFVLIFVLNAQPAMAATLSACGNLTTPNEVYVLDRDISITGTCLNVKENNITIDCKGYRIGYAQSIAGYGIISNSYNFTTVKNCYISDLIASGLSLRSAIFFSNSRNGTIFNNTIKTFGRYGNGIYLASSSNFNNLSSNRMNITSDLSFGVLLSSSSNNILTGNVVNSSLRSSFRIVSSSNNILTGNKGYSKKMNTYALEGTSSLHYSNSIDSSNQAEGRPVNYTYNENNLVFNNINFTKYGQVIFAWSRNITITNSNFSRDSLNLFDTDNSTISNNRMTTSTGYGVYLYSSSNNSIDGNSITTSNPNYDGYGIYLNANSQFNILFNNTVTTSLGRYGNGIYLLSSSRNRIKENIISSTSWDGYGIYLFSAPNNDLIKNNITTSGAYPDIYGIRIHGSDNNTLYNNTVTTLGRDSFGIYFSAGSTNNTLRYNDVYSSQASSYVLYGTTPSSYKNSIDSSNYAEGYLVNYTYNASNHVFNNINFTKYGQVMFGWGRNITITNSSFSHDSLALFSVDKSRISGNRVNTSTGRGICLYSSSNNSVKYNSINTSGLYGYGICLIYGLDNNNVTDNRIATKGNYSYGIYLDSDLYSQRDNSLNNNIINTSGLSGYGIALSISHSYHNIDNNSITTSADGGMGVYLYLCSYSNLSNNRIKTSNKNGHGFNLWSSSNNNFINNTINNSNGGIGINAYTSSNNNVFSGVKINANNAGNTANGIFFSGSSINNHLSGVDIREKGDNGRGVILDSGASSNTFSGVNVTTNGYAAYGIYLLSSSNGNIFSGMNVKTDGTNAFGIYFYTGSTSGNNFSRMDVRAKGDKANALRLASSGSHNFTVYDSILNASYSGVPEFYIANTVVGGTWNFTNVTKSNKNPIRTTWIGGKSGKLNMHWYLDVRVRNTTGPLQGANVTSYNDKDARAFSELTASNGMIAKKTLLEYTRNSTNIANGTNYVWSSPYNASIYLAGYSTYLNKNINLSNNIFLDINLACFCPIGQDWIVKEDCYLTNSICNIPDQRVTCLDTGSIVMGNYTIIAKKAITPINHGCLLMDNRSRLLIK